MEPRERCRSLDPEDVPVRPTAEQPFVVRSVAGDRLVVSVLDREAERPLWRDGFAVPADRLRGEVAELETRIGALLAAG
jgi:hypothetical protein